MKITSKTRLQSTTPEDDIQPAKENGNLATLAGAISGGRMQVDVISGGGAGEQYADGTTINAAYKGNLVLGENGSKYQILKVDNDGHLQVDVLTLPTAIVQATDLDIRNLTATDVVTVTGGAGQTADIKITLDSEAVVLGAGSATIGKLAANSGVDIGDVDITSIVPGVGATNLGKAEDAAHSSADTGVMALGVRKDSPANLSGADGDYEPFQVSAGRLWVSAKVDTALPAGTNNIGGVDVLTLPSLPAGTNTIGKLAANNGIDIGDVTINNAGGAAAVNIQDGGNTITVDGTVTAAQATAASLKCEPDGSVAHDSADSGNPIKIGAKAVLFDGSAPPNAAVAEGDRTNLISDEYGRPYVETTHPNYWSVSADYSSAQTNTSIKSAPGAGLSLYITDIVISNGATAGNITLLDGSGGAVKFEIYPAINGGCSTNLRTPIKLTANTALCITSTTVTTHSVNICGFIAP